MHPSGSIGSDIGVESVSIFMTCLRSFLAGSSGSMVLPYDFDILRPSTPGTVATSSRMRASGSFKYSPSKAWLNFVAMSRVISKCCF